jgi:hypothetical protein
VGKSLKPSAPPRGEYTYIALPELTYSIFMFKCIIDPTDYYSVKESSMKHTKALIVITILCLFIAAGNTYAADPSKAKGPRAVFSEKSFEFEPVVAGTEVTHEFVIRNEGTDVLKIENVNAT